MPHFAGACASICSVKAGHGDRKDGGQRLGGSTQIALTRTGVRDVQFLVDRRVQVVRESGQRFRCWRHVRLGLSGCGQFGGGRSTKADQQIRTGEPSATGLRKSVSGECSFED